MALSDDRWREADAILDEALERPAEERRAHISRRCDGDPELRALVERLLADCETAEHRLTPGAAIAGAIGREIADATPGELASDPEGDGPGEGDVVDRYRLVRELGRGGMAVVYLAERADSQFEHQVALKLIRRGIDTDDVIRRFHRERQILARNRHPNIARLLDGGVTDDGLPYFVMEFVDGLPIDRWCDEHRLSVRKRIELFLEVCSALEYAHRNLVVHRDIKPSNILVQQGGQVRLLDFGIAKLLGPDGEDDVRTRTHARFMTPAYASPEQVRGEPVTTASDVYQLGLLLYRLLTGRGPYAMDDRRSDALARAILEKAPTRPSDAVTDDAGAGRARDTTPSRLARRLDGDLDNIVLMALRKEPERRYSTVAALVHDLRRHLAGRPVSARPDTLTYRLGKFVRRNRTGVGVGAVALVLVAALTAIYTARLADERDRALAARAQAENAREEAEEVAGFLVDLFRFNDPEEARGREITARDLLDEGAERVAREFDDRPHVQARLVSTIGDVYRSLGLLDQAEPLLEAALATRRADPDLDPLELAHTLDRAAELRMAQSRFDEAETLAREGLEIRERRLPGDAPEVVESMVRIGSVHFLRGESDAAVETFEHARARLGDDASPELRVTVLSDLAVAYQAQDRLEEAYALVSETLKLLRQLRGPDHPDVGISLHNLGVFASQLERYEEAERHLTDALELNTRLFGDDHPMVLNTLSNIATLYENTGRVEQAEELHWKTVEKRREVLGPDHFDVARALGKLALLYQRQERWTEALETQQELNRIAAITLGPDHPRNVRTVALEGTFLRELGRDAAAEERFRRSVSIAEAAHGAGAVETSWGLLGLARLAAARGDRERARALFDEAELLREQAWGADDPRTVEVVEARRALVGAGTS